MVTRKNLVFFPALCLDCGEFQVGKYSLGCGYSIHTGHSAKFGQFFLRLFLPSTSWLVVSFIGVTKDYSSGGNLCQCLIIFLRIFSFCGRVTQGLQSDYCRGYIHHPQAIVYWKHGPSQKYGVNLLSGRLGRIKWTVSFQLNTTLSCPRVKLLCIQGGVKSECPQSYSTKSDHRTLSTVQRAKIIPRGRKPVVGWQTCVQWYSLKVRDRPREPVQAAGTASRDAACARVTTRHGGAG